MSSWFVAGGMTHSSKTTRTFRVSIRTLLLAMLGVAMVVSIFRFGASNANSFHAQLVLGFAIPGGSIGYDLCPSSRGIVCGTCLFAGLGTCLVSAIILWIGW